MRQLEIENTKFVLKGLSNATYKTSFQEDSVGSNIFSKGNNLVQMTTLDEFLKGKNERVGFIKFDLEGSAFMALQGAEKLYKNGNLYCQLQSTTVQLNFSR